MPSGRPPRETFVTRGGFALPPSIQLVQMGDPFLGGFFRGLGRVARGVGRIISRGVGAAGRIALGGGPMGPGTIQNPFVTIPAGSGPLPPIPIQIDIPGFPRPTIPTSPMGHGTAGLLTGQRHRRRMNPLNPRALRRSLRRIEGFRRFARRAGFVPRGTRVKRVFPFRRRRRAA